MSASPGDYNITRLDGGELNASSVRGSGTTVHLVGYTPRLADGQMVNVSISSLSDMGTGYDYAGTSVPYMVTINSTAAAPANSSVSIARVASIASSGGTMLNVTYTEPVDAMVADYTMWTIDGAPVAVTGLDGSGTRSHVITHDSERNGTRVRLGAMPLANTGSESVYLGGTYSLVIGSMVDNPTLLVVEDMSSSRLVRLIRAEITAPNTITVSYTAGIEGMASDYTNLVLTPGGSRTVTDVAGSGTSTHTLTFDGAKARSNATATMSIAFMDYPPAYFEGRADTTVGDGQDAPYVYAITTNASSSGTYTTGDLIYITIEFSELVIMGTDEESEASGGTTQSVAAVGAADDRLSLLLNTNGTAGLSRTYSVGTMSYEFKYVIQKGEDADGFLDYMNTSSLIEKAGVAVRNAIAGGGEGTEDVNLTLPAVGSPDSLASNRLIVYDSPRVEALSAPAGQYNAGDLLRLTASLTRNVTLSAAPSLELGSPAARAAYSSGNGTATYEFGYTVRPGDTTASLLRSVAIVVPGGASMTLATSAGMVFVADIARIEGVSGLTIPGVTVGTGGGGILPPPPPPPVTQTPTAVAPSFGGFGGGGGGGRGGSSGGGGVGLPVGGPGDAITIYSAAWNCNEETIRIAVDDGASSPTVSVLSSDGTTFAAVSKVQGLEGRIVYEAFLPDDDVLSIRAVSVEGRVVMTASEIVRIGGACTGEVVFNQYREAAEPRMEQEDAPTEAMPERTDPKPRVVQPPIDDAVDTPPVDAEDDVQMPPPQERPAFEMEAGRDASYYVKRYAEQASYREWFDSSYPQYDSICEAVGAASGCVEAYLEEQAKDDDAPPQPPPMAECDEGQVMRNGECVEVEEPQPAPPAVADDDDSGCLIATAAYGTELAPQVQALREVRDATLLSTGTGSAFMSSFSSVYYAFSPHVADLEREMPAFRQAIGLFLTPMVYALQVVTLAEPGSESGVLAYGIVAIALVAGMYVAAPAAGAWYAGRLVAAAARNRRQA